MKWLKEIADWLKEWADVVSLFLSIFFGILSMRQFKPKPKSKKRSKKKR